LIFSSLVSKNLTLKSFSLLRSSFPCTCPSGFWKQEGTSHHPDQTNNHAGAVRHSSGGRVGVTHKNNRKDTERCIRKKNLGIGSLLRQNPAMTGKIEHDNSTCGQDEGVKDCGRLYSAARSRYSSRPGHQSQAEKTLGRDDDTNEIDSYRGGWSGRSRNRNDLTNGDQRDARD
jgi:hypothetical protein